MGYINNKGEQLIFSGLTENKISKIDTALGKIFGYLYEKSDLEGGDNDFYLVTGEMNTIVLYNTNENTDISVTVSYRAKNADGVTSTAIGFQTVTIAANSSWTTTRPKNINVFRINTTLNTLVQRYIKVSAYCSEESNNNIDEIYNRTEQKKQNRMLYNASYDADVVGSAISLQKYNSKLICNLPNISNNFQGIAVYNDTLCVGGDGGNYYLWDLTTNTRISENLQFGSYTGDSKNHVGALQFDTVKYDDSDDYPLLYVTTNYQKVCFVERITTTGSTQVQKITVTDLPETYAISWWLDTLSDKLYLLAMTGESYTNNKNDECHIYVWDKPEVTSTNTEVSLSVEDAEWFPAVSGLHQSAIGYGRKSYILMGTYDGMTQADGKIYDDGERRIVVYNNLTKQVESIININSVSDTEPEGIAIWDDKILLVYTNKLYSIDFFLDSSSNTDVYTKDEVDSAISGVFKLLSRDEYKELTPNSSTLYMIQEDGDIVAMYLGTVPCNFLAYTNLIKLTLTNDGNGTTTGGGKYDEGTAVTITAIPNTGYEFKQWSDGNTDNPRIVTVNEDTIINAEFEMTYEYYMSLHQLYSLPEETVFDGVDDTIDTDIKLFKADNSFTVIIDFINDTQTTSTTNATILSGWNDANRGVNIDFINNSNIRIFNCITSSGTDIYYLDGSNTKVRKKIMLSYDKDTRLVSMYDKTDGYSDIISKTTTISDTFTLGSLDLSIMLGARHLVNGTIDRYWAGTIYDCKIYDVALDSTKIF